MKNYKKYFLALLDIIIVATSYFMAIFLKSEFTFNVKSFNYYLGYIPLIIIIYLISFIIFKLYRTLWIYASVEDYLNVAFANLLGIFGSIIIDQFVKNDITISTIIIGGLLSFILTEGVRIIYRFIVNRSTSGIINSDGMKKVIIIGAGKAGKLLLTEIHHNPNLSYKAVGFVDDDPTKIYQTISGVPVLGAIKELPELIKEYSVDEVILSIPSLSMKEKTDIINSVSSSKIKIKTLPNIPDFINSNVKMSKIRDVEITDLLGRKEIKMDSHEIKEYLENKTILVTGGGGSIGSELCRQIASFNPKKLIIFDIYENNAYEIQNELIRKYPNLNLLVLIGSVRDYKKVDDVIKENMPDIIFHAAAHKHVPLMETSPAEAVKNNVFGTYNLSKAADKYNVPRFLLISTDKAVNPTNIMGATKRLCEMIVQTFNKISKNTEFVAVRFGNVLGSNGSVIPLFKKQIAAGGPVTVTHKEITRFFMTIPEAVQLVLTAGSFAKGGEIFVLDMGEPVKIYDLAENLIKLSGYTPNKDMMIEVTGLRPGEKLYEELLMAEEGLQKTKNELIYIGKPNEFDFDTLLGLLEELKEVAENPNSSNYEVKNKVKSIVDTYNYNPKLDIEEGR